MNKLMNSFCMILISLGVIEAKADYIAPEVKTQINQQTDLFQKSVDNLQSFEMELEDGKQLSIHSMGDGKTSAPSGLSFISQKSKKELESESSNLDAIHENDLNSKGREEMIKNDVLNELYPDYLRPLNKQHIQDAKSIAKAQEHLPDNLLVKLQELGIDCKTIKGTEKHEPEYFLQIKNTTHRDTVYNQALCEELRNQYNCSDELTLTCKSQGIAWGEWQDKQIYIPGGELVNSGKAVFWIDHTAKRCFEYKLTVGSRRVFSFEFPPDPAVVQAMREFLTTKHPGSTIDNISTEMSSSWYGGLFSIDGWSYLGRTLGSKDYAWQTYVINYKYRDGNLACFEWSESWTERCRLQ